MNYIDKQNSITTGINCSDDRKIALEEMQNTKHFYDKTEGRQYKHYVHSFKPTEITPMQANKLCEQLFKEKFPSHEIFIATHVDKEHIHNHVIINSVNFETGKKLHLENNFLKALKQRSNEISKEHGITTYDIGHKAERGEVRAWTMNKYKSLEKHATEINGKLFQSYYAQTIINIDKSRENANNKQEFIKSMESKGFKVNWQDHKKHITITTPSGKKIRTSNIVKTLNDDSYSKNGLLAKFKDNALSKSKNIFLTEHKNPFELNKINTLSNINNDIHSITGLLKKAARTNENDHHCSLKAKLRHKETELER